MKLMTYFPNSLHDVKNASYCFNYGTLRKSVIASTNGIIHIEHLIYHELAPVGLLTYLALMRQKQLIATRKRSRLELQTAN